MAESKKTAAEVKEQVEEQQESQNTESKKGGKKIARRKATKVSLAQSNIEWDFKENPIFIGYIVGESRADVPNREDKTKTDYNKLIGYVVEDEDEERWTVPNWALIHDAFNADFEHPEHGQTTLMKLINEPEKPLIQIEYGGQGKKSNGDKFTIINVDVLEWD